MLIVILNEHSGRAFDCPPPPPGGHMVDCVGKGGHGVV